MYFFQLIQKLREKHQKYASNIESDSGSENEIKDLDIERHKEIPINKDYHELLKTNGEQSMKKNYQFPNTSNFDDTG